MIWVIIFIAVIVAVIAALAVCCYREVNISNVVVGIASIITAVCIIFLIEAGVSQLDTNSTNERNIVEYEELLLYHDVVEKSNDELLRWNYYQKVQNWNEKVIDYTIGRDSVWRSAFYGSRDFDNCDFIMFELRRG